MTSRSERALAASLAATVEQIREAAPKGRATVEASGDMLRGLCDDVGRLLSSIESQEAIEAGALVSYDVYWGCRGFVCTACPARIGGLTPGEFYEVSGCVPAQMLDLLRRQRALDEREAAE